mmetsp:Transcript_55034/g.159351  ORF Transcript_55034/g.159351 Transcript_55034/m.159351 type:complete len:301 (-) Transcript_55034:1565-2467(-)
MSSAAAMPASAASRCSGGSCSRSTTVAGSSPPSWLEADATISRRSSQVRPPSNGNSMPSKTLFRRMSNRTSCKAPTSELRPATLRSTSLRRCFASRDSLANSPATFSLTRSSCCRSCNAARRAASAASADSSSDAAAFRSNSAKRSATSAASFAGSRASRSTIVCSNISSSASTMPFFCSRTLTADRAASAFLRASRSKRWISSTPISLLRAAKWEKTIFPISSSRPRCSTRNADSSSSRRNALVDASFNACCARSRSRFRRSNSVSVCSSCCFAAVARASARMTSALKASVSAAIASMV